MNTSKFLLGGVVAGIAYNLFGYVFYDLLFGNTLGEMMPNMKAVQGLNPVALVIGNLSLGFLLSYIFERWAGIRTFMSGATAGATIGFLVAFGYDCVFHGTTNLMTWGGVFVDALIFTALSAIAGGLAGWALGAMRKDK